MAALLAEIMFTNCNSSLETAYSEPTILCVLPSSVRPSTLSFNRTFCNVTYCL